MYIVTKGGSKVEIDENKLDKGDRWRHNSFVAAFDDDVYLDNVWVLSLYKCTDNDMMPKFGDRFERELVREYRFNHKPTKEEILWAMSANGLGEYDMAFVEKGYEQAVEFEG